MAATTRKGVRHFLRSPNGASAVLGVSDDIRSPSTEIDVNAGVWGAGFRDIPEVSGLDVTYGAGLGVALFDTTTTTWTLRDLLDRLGLDCEGTIWD